MYSDKEINTNRAAMNVEGIGRGDEPCMVEDGATRPERLLRSVNGVESIIRHLEELRSMIGLTCSPVGNEMEKHPQPNLLSVLNESPHRLDCMVEEVHSQIDEIIGAIR